MEEGEIGRGLSRGKKEERDSHWEGKGGRGEREKEKFRLID